MDILFPYSYVSVNILSLLGCLVVLNTVGFIISIVLLVLIYSGVIRITPILKFFSWLVSTTMPARSAKIHTNIKESFKSRFTVPIPEGKYIYAWHPHGVISMSQFFHIGTSFTDWPSHLRPISGAIFSALQWLPFGHELMEYSTAIPGDYPTMKDALVEGKSISISVGGMREMLGDSYIVTKRRGIFKMALETGTPIVPVLSFGENTLFTLVEIYKPIQDWLVRYDSCLCFPTFNSFRMWINLLYEPLTKPITSVVGTPIPVEQILEPTEDDIAALRATYIEALKDLFMKENPNKDEVFSIV